MGRAASEALRRRDGWLNLTSTGAGSHRGGRFQERKSEGGERKKEIGEKEKKRKF